MLDEEHDPMHVSVNGHLGLSLAVVDDEIDAFDWHAIKQVIDNYSSCHITYHKSYIPPLLCHWRRWWTSSLLFCSRCSSKPTDRPPVAALL